MSRADLADTLDFTLHALGIKDGIREHRGIPGRRFRFDLAWPDAMVAVEVHGGQWMRGRHNRPAGFSADCEKTRLAMKAGWVLLPYTGEDVKKRSQEVAEEIREMLKQRRTG